jgi:group I intron endonuclease
MNEAGIIYCARNKLNGKVYIGQTVQGLVERKRGHVSASRVILNRYFPKAIYKYGVDGFKWKILCRVEALTAQLTLEYLNIVEQMCIKQYDSMNEAKGYNCTLGGDGVCGHVHTEVTKRRLSQRFKGRSFSIETRRKIGEANRRRVVTGETKQKIREANLGKKLSEEHKRKIGISGKGRVNKPISEETRKRMSDAQKGKKASMESRRKQSESRKGTHRSKETRKRMSEAAKRRLPMSEITKKRISEAHKGIVPWNKGKAGVYTEETLNRMRESQIGKPSSVETRCKMSIARKGEKNHMFGKHPTEETKQKMRKSRKKKGAI